MTAEATQTEKDWLFITKLLCKSGFSSAEVSDLRRHVEDPLHVLLPASTSEKFTALKLPLKRIVDFVGRNPNVGTCIEDNGHGSVGLSYPGSSPSLPEVRATVRAQHKAGLITQEEMTVLLWALQDTPLTLGEQIPK